MKIFKRFLNDIETQLKTKNNIYFLLHFGWFLSSILQILTRIKSFSASSSLQEKTENKLQSYNFWNFLLVSVSFNKETVAENRFWKKILAFKKKTKYQRLSVVKIWFLQVAGTAPMKISKKFETKFKGGNKMPFLFSLAKTTKLKWA